MSRAFYYRLLRKDDDIAMLQSRTDNFHFPAWEGRGDHSICEFLQEFKSTDVNSTKVKYAVGCTIAMDMKAVPPTPFGTVPDEFKWRQPSDVRDVLFNVAPKPVPAKKGKASVN